MQYNRKQWVIALMIGAMTIQSAWATGRYFTYTYEPETMPAGVAEFEQWITLRTQRNRMVGQQNYNRWELREEFEYGVTDNYTAALYLNTKATNYKEPGTGDTMGEFEFAGIAIENRYMVLNPALSPVGLTLYLEPGYSGDEAELEQKIILGQRHGEWKWALNLIHETEWELNENKTEGVFAVAFGLTRHLNPRWSIGVEFVNRNVISEYRDWEYSAFFIGPVVAYSAENWWAALTVLPQVYGTHHGDGPDPDGESGLVLDHQERLNVRLIFGISF